MEYTDIRITPIAGTSKLKAVGKIQLCGVLDVSFRVMEGSKGLFVGWPSREGKDKEGNKKYYDEVYFIDRDQKEEVAAAILKQFSGEGESTVPKSIKKTASAPF